MEYCSRCRKVVNTRSQEKTLLNKTFINIFCEECGLTIMSSKVSSFENKLYNEQSKREKKHGKKKRKQK